MGSKNHQSGFQTNNLVRLVRSSLTKFSSSSPTYRALSVHLEGSASVLLVAVLNNWLKQSQNEVVIRAESKTRTNITCDFLENRKYASESVRGKD